MTEEIEYEWKAMSVFLKEHANDPVRNLVQIYKEEGWEFEGGALRRPIKPANPLTELEIINIEVQAIYMIDDPDDKVRCAVKDIPRLITEIRRLKSKLQELGNG